VRPLDPAVLPHLRPARAVLVAVVTAGGLSGLLVVAQAFALATAVTAAVVGQGLREPVTWLIGVVAARAAVGLLGDLFARRAADRVSGALRRRLLAHAAQLASRPGGERRVGSTAALATHGVAAVVPYLTRYLPALVLAAVLPVLTVLAIATQDLASALVVVLTLPLVPVFAALVGWATEARARRQWRSMAALSGHFLDVVRGLPTLVAHRRAEAQVATIAAVSDRHRRATLHTLRLAFASSAVLELVATLSVALVAVLVGLRLATGGLDLHTALVVLLLAPEAYWPLRRVGAEFHAAAEGAAVFTDADALLAEPVPGWPAEPVPEQTAGQTLPSPAEAPLRLERLSVTYPGRTQPALRDVSALVRPGEVVAVTGPSGCGKSTLLAVLIGLVPVTSGRVTVGDTDLADVDVDAWRRLVTWVPQRPWLGAGTVADVVRLGSPAATVADVWRALSEVGLREVVASLPQGLDTPVGDDARLLSAGQRARLAVARAVLAPRPLVLLDEPTAHLDAETEQVVLAVLQRLARTGTVIVVSHRPAVLAAADRVLDLAAAQVPA